MVIFIIDEETRTMPDTYGNGGEQDIDIACTREFGQELLGTLRASNFTMDTKFQV